MKKLIKISILLVLLAVFAFSNNPTITGIRHKVADKATELFKKGDKLYDEKAPEIQEKTVKVISEMIDSTVVN